MEMVYTNFDQHRLRSYFNRKMVNLSAYKEHKPQNFNRLWQDAND